MTSIRGEAHTHSNRVLELCGDLVLWPQSQVEELVLQPHGTVVHVRHGMAFAAAITTAQRHHCLEATATATAAGQRLRPWQCDRRSHVKVLQADETSVRVPWLHDRRITGCRRIGGVRLERVVLASGQAGIRDEHRRRLQKVD